ncbi:MAG: hypothetical protein ACKVPX_09340 [Myxococcaceae bacterium]
MRIVRNAPSRLAGSRSDTPARAMVVMRAHAWARRHLQYTANVGRSNHIVSTPVGAYRGRIGSITVNAVHRRGHRMFELLIAEPQRELRLSFVGPDNAPSVICELMPRNGEAVGARVEPTGQVHYYRPGYPPAYPDEPISWQQGNEDVAAAGGAVILSRGEPYPREVLNLIRWGAATTANHFIRVEQRD